MDRVFQAHHKSKNNCGQFEEDAGFHYFILSKMISDETNVIVPINTTAKLILKKSAATPVKNAPIA